MKLVSQNNKMSKFYISPGVIIATIGMVGLLFTFVDKSGTFGSTIPLGIFFILIMIVGILIEAYPKIDETYGEFQSPREFS